MGGKYSKKRLAFFFYGSMIGDTEKSLVMF
jgi:hypothetical protein